MNPDTILKKKHDHNPFNPLKGGTLPGIENITENL